MQKWEMEEENDSCLCSVRLGSAADLTCLVKRLYTGKGVATAFTA